MINSAIFRSYDIRGNSQKDLTPLNVFKIGFCFGRLTINKDNNIICVGRDGRLSSSELFEALVKGLARVGAKVISIGVVPTPALYYADKKFKPAASIMITGSHNPKDDNGFKMLHLGKSFFGEQIQILLTTILDTNWENIQTLNNEIQTIEEVNINDQYVERILEGMNIKADLKVAWDPGNGAAGIIVQMLKTKLKNTNIIINGEINGNFPAHHPDPTKPENLTQLIELVQTENCDFGVAFDGDADRIGIVTQKGKILWGDQMLCLFAKNILKENPGSLVIADVKASQVIFDQVASYGGKPLMWKTGHSFIKTKMSETKAILAGEMSGHIFFADKYYGYDDAIYAAIRFIDLVSSTSQTIDEQLEELPKVYNTPEIRIKTHEDEKFKIIEEIKQQIRSKGINFIDIDGLRVNTKNGWWLLRASNTEASLIVRCESLTREGLQILKNDLINLLSPYELIFPENFR